MENNNSKTDANSMEYMLERMLILESRVRDLELKTRGLEPDLSGMF